MAGELTLTLATQLLKTIYLPRVRMQLNDEMSPAYKQIESSTEHVVGQTATFNIHVDRSSGTGSRNELDNLPEADGQKTQKGTVSLKYMYGRVKFTGQTMMLAKQDAAAYVDAAGYEMERIVEDLRYDCSRQLFNTSQAFIIPTSGVAVGQVVPVANATPAQFRQLIVGMTVDIGTSGTQANGATAVVVASFDTVAKTITFTGSVASVTNNMFIRKVDTFATATGTKERIGLPSIVSSQDTLHGISGVTFARWNSYINSNGAVLRAPTELLLEKVVDEIAIEGGKVADFAVAPHDVVRNYGAQLQSQKRYNDTTVLKGGVGALTIASGEATVGLVSDRFAPANQMWFLNSEHLMFHMASDWEWMDDDGAVLNRIPNKDAYEATLYKYAELATDRRNVHGRVDDLAGA